MTIEREPVGAEQENIDSAMLGILADRDAKIALALLTSSLNFGCCLFSVGERLNPPFQLALGTLFLTNAVLGQYFLARAALENIVSSRSFSRKETLDGALEILGTPVGDEELGTFIKELIGPTDFTPLIPGRQLALLPSGKEELSVVGQENLPTGGSLVPLAEAREEGVILSRAQMETILTTISERGEALERVREELQLGSRRELQYSNIQRGKIVDTLNKMLREESRLIGLPEAGILLREVLVNVLQERSPEVLEKSVAVIEQVLTQLMQGEKTRGDRIAAAHHEALRAALMSGASIPPNLEASILSGKMEGMKSPLIDILSFNADEVEALAWIFTTLSLRPMPEVREPAQSAIMWLIKELSNPDKNLGRLALVQERILRILQLGAEVPNLGLGISIDDLAKRLKLEGANRVVLPANDLNIGGSLDSITLVTLPPGKEISPKALGQLVTRAALEQPFSSYLGIARAGLRIGQFESKRVREPKVEEIEWFFVGKDVLNWLLAGQDPGALIEMNQFKEGAESVGERETRGDLLQLAA